MLQLSSHIDPDSVGLVRALEACELKSLNHGEHIQTAWACAHERTLAELLTEFPPLLQAYARSKGVPDYYHATITYALLWLIYERVQSAPTADWVEFKALYPELFDRDLLLRSYTPATINSEEARSSPLFPSRA